MLPLPVLAVNDLAMRFRTGGVQKRQFLRRPRKTLGLFGKSGQETYGKMYCRAKNPPEKSSSGSGYTQDGKKSFETSPQKYR